MKNYLFYIILFISLATITTLISRSFRVSQVPNGSEFSCNTCHTNGGGSPRNSFGKQIEQFHLTEPGAAGNVKWTPLLASLDADNDGISNGEELQEPFGIFMGGDAAPGTSSLVSSPGLASSTSYKKLSINFSGMTPHVDQMLHLSIYDRTEMKEIIHTTEIIKETFIIETTSILVGHSYFINLFADHDGNGLYSPPPADHTWQLELNNVDGDEVIDFAHNTNFVDLDWKYNLTINFTGMTPHIDQLLELRIIDENMVEAGRTRIEYIPSSDFSLNVSGLELGKNYTAQLYADLNKNGKYDSPPTDHAWEFSFNTNNGDAVEEFSHNTTFVDINWAYQYTVNLTGMVPHENQMLSLRVVSEEGIELGRKTIQVPIGGFSISIPGLVPSNSYNADFYADHNGNGEYDSPPVDHAWRLTFTAEESNFVENFAHNTNFVDIEWNDITDVNDDLSNLPDKFDLLQNYPNPFNPSTNIRFQLSEANFTELKIFDILGKEIATLLSEQKSAGNYEVNFDASSLSNGTYIYRLQSGNKSSAKKMVLLK